MLVNCVAYEDGHKLAEIIQSEIHSYLKRPGCFVWVALRDASEAELTEMGDQFDLHELTVEDAHHGHQRPKIEEYGDCLFAVMHSMEREGEEFAVGEVHVFVGRNYVLSSRNRMKTGFQEVRTRCEREPELLRYGAGYVLYALMDAMVDRYFPVLDELESELDAVEERIFSSKSPRANIEALYELKRRLTVLKHAVAPLLDATGKLFGGRVPPVCAGLAEYFRDVYDHLVRLNATVDAVRDTVITALSVNVGMIALAENEVTKRLAAYAALVAVPTLIAGIYGMNFAHMPELAWNFGYPVALGTMVGIDGYLFYRLRKAGWL